MFATLVGTDTKSDAHVAVFSDLLQCARKRGLTPGDTELRVEPDQIPLREWSLELRGPETKKADFLLAVTAPKTPGISPIPAKITVAGPMFAVVVMDNCFGVWREGRDFEEVVEPSRVKSAFSDFLDTIGDPCGA